MITELQSTEEVKILKSHYIGHLGFISGDCPYVIPITYYYDESTHSILSYSAEGHKIDSMRENKLVSMQVSDITTLSEWKSVLVIGQFEELEGPDAKYKLHQFSDGVKAIIRKSSGEEMKFIKDFSSKVSELSHPVIYRIKIDEIIGKQRLS